MKYTVRTSIVSIVGSIWQPNTTAAMSYTLSASDVDNARGEDGHITRESVQAWVDTHAGDFSNIHDFSASIEDGEDSIEIPWEQEESEGIYVGQVKEWSGRYPNQRFYVIGQEAQ